MLQTCSNTFHKLETIHPPPAPHPPPPTTTRSANATDLVDRFYISLFSALKEIHCARV